MNAAGTDRHNAAEQGVEQGNFRRSLGGWGSVIALFVIGLSITFTLYQYFVRSDEERLRERVLRGTQVLASSESRAEIDTDIQHAFATFDSIEQGLAAEPRITTELLNELVWQSPNPLTQSVGLRYLPRVRFNPASSAYEMLDLQGEWISFDLPVLNFDEQSRLVPDTTRADEYYPVLYTNGDSILATVAGVNFLSDPQYALALRHARDTGVATYRTSYPRGGSEEPYLLHVIFKAVYKGGKHPATVEGRRADLVGYLSSVIMIESASFIDYIPESYKGIHALFLPVTPGFSLDDLAPEGRALVDSGNFAAAPMRRENSEMLVIAKPSNGQIRALQTNDRWWALSIGSLLTVWVCSLLLAVNRRSRQMKQTILESTSALAERTRRLEEVNSALEKSEELYRVVATNVHDVIYSHDVDGVINYISPSIKRTLGYDAPDMIGRNILSYMEPAAAARVREALERSKADTAEFSEIRAYETEFLTRDGSTKLLESTISKLIDANGAASGFLVVSRDISDRKKDLEEKEKLKLTVQQAQKMEAIGTLAGGIAHDFNNLLSGILGHAELIKTNPRLNADAEHSATIIETAALRGKQLTTQLLGFARKGQFQRKNVDVNSMITEIVQLLERTLGKDIAISRKLSARSPVVLGDPGQINQILLNLAVNARDAMPTGGRLSFETAVVTLAGDAASLQLPPGDYCEILVSDTGTGIPKEKQQRIFEPFFTDKEEGKGTGLGLAMVYGVVDNHGGKITVYSEVGRGAAFRILLPLSKEVSREAVSTEAPALHGKGKVMVVDDETIVRDLTATLLARLGFETVCFSSGRQAIEYFRDHHEAVDMAIIDLVMPEMDGKSCVQQMYKIDPALKAIITSGFAHESVMTESGDEHVHGFIQKPFTLKQLSDLVTTILAR
jgi:two-component system, cell cycle sensor histidine kinase and response regulator CckA